MTARGLMVCASRQHVGKTTSSLAITSGLLKRFDVSAEMDNFLD